jgi:hypothetical protein
MATMEACPAGVAWSASTSPLIGPEAGQCVDADDGTPWAIGGEDAWALLPSLIPREEYIHCAPYGAIDSLRLHAINYA